MVEEQQEQYTETLNAALERRAEDVIKGDRLLSTYYHSTIDANCVTDDIDAPVEKLRSYGGARDVAAYLTWNRVVDLLRYDFDTDHEMRYPTFDEHLERAIPFILARKAMLHHLHPDMLPKNTTWPIMTTSMNNVKFSSWDWGETCSNFEIRFIGKAEDVPVKLRKMRFHITPMMNFPGKFLKICPKNAEKYGAHLKQVCEDAKKQVETDYKVNAFLHGNNIL